MKDQIIGLKTLDLRSSLPKLIDTPLKASKKRVFTEDEWEFLNTRPTKELWFRIRRGDFLIRLLHSPEMLNMTPAQASMISSNLRFQQDAIMEIIKSRGEE